METLWGIFNILTAGIIALGGAGGVIVGLYKWARRPNDNQNARLDKHDQLLDNDNKRLKALEEWRNEKNDSDRIMMRAMYALLQHNIDGNHKEKLNESLKEIDKFLFK